MSSPDATPSFGHDGWPPGWTVEYVPVTGSTNDDILATAAVRPDRSVLATGHQTAGRGRLDRRWDAPPGANLLVSLLFHRVPDPPSELTRRVGLAALDAARTVAGLDAVLKWPNDVMVGEAKLAGVLAERRAVGPVAVGLGLNVGWAPDGAVRLGEGIAPAAVLRAVLAAFDALPDDITAAYRAALSTLGRRIRVHLRDGVVDGIAVDVEPDGRLVVDDGTSAHRFAAGDVVHVRPATPN